MCGICGILATSDAFACDEETVARVCDVIAHPGPDDAGSWSRPDQGIALGHRRLSIVDLSPAGHNPMPNEDGSVWITFNGEIYNHLELRSELERKGHVYRSHTDTETILHLYEEEGPRCVERMNGMFAFAIWDRRRGELFLARDRLGVKPLLYAQVPGGFLFASEAKGILAHPSFRAELDEEAFHHYLTFAFAPPPLTMFKNMRKLAPAERMVVAADGSTRSDIYWDPLSSELAAEVRSMSEKEITDRLRDLLRDSIRQRMMADVPYGVFLSGGVDSSTNVALMAELTDEPVRTYSTAPRGHEKYDELQYANVIAKQFKTDHHEVIVDEADLFGFLPELMHFQDEPTSDWTSVPQHFVTKLARDDGTIVVQVGEGADEIFHGYRGYHTHRKVVVPFQRLPRSVRRPIGRAALGATQRSGRGVRH